MAKTYTEHQRRVLRELVRIKDINSVCAPSEIVTGHAVHEARRALKDLVGHAWSTPERIGRFITNAARKISRGDAELEKRIRQHLWAWQIEYSGAAD
jgi:hypothetical protein